MRKKEGFEWVSIDIKKGFTPYYFDLRGQKLHILMKKAKPREFNFKF